MLSITLPRVSKQRMALLGLVAGAIAVAALVITDAFAASTPPVINEPILATFHASDLKITGDGFGSPMVGSTINFSETELEGGAKSVDSTDVTLWTNTEISMTLPAGVVSGEVTVTVGGKTSAARDLMVFAYSNDDLPSPGLPLAVALDAKDGTLWLNSEFNSRLRSLAPGDPNVFTDFEPPQAEDGIFVFLPGGFFCNQGATPAPTPFACRTRTSLWGEDVEVYRDPGDNDLSVWFTQGGAFGFSGQQDKWGEDLFNLGRVIRYKPTPQTFDCYNAPESDPDLLGVLVDEARNMIWYSERDVPNGSGNAIVGLTFDTNLATPNPLSNCTFDPYAIGATPDPICTGTPAPTCHYRIAVGACIPAHMELDDEGYIWFTEYWGHLCGGPPLPTPPGSFLARLDPDTGDLIELPLPAAHDLNSPHPILGRVVGPWELEFDAFGDLWVSEFFDATVLRVNLSGVTDLEAECGELDKAGQNPCIDEVFVAYDEPGATKGSGPLHTVSIGADGLVWFGVADTIGFISTTDNDEVVLFPSKDVVTSIEGNVQNLVTKDVWFAQLFQQKIGRLQLLDKFDDTSSLDQDADGLTDAQELEMTLTDPLDPDSDDNGTLDGDEDQDGDGCQDKFEVGDDETKGGLRDPLYAHDYYDASVVDSASHPHAFSHTADFDGVIDLPNDYLGVSQHFSPSGAPPYDVIFDRGVTIGANHWERAAPDGVIDLPNDILGVGLQLQHNCQ